MQNAGKELYFLIPVLVIWIEDLEIKAFGNGFGLSIFRLPQVAVPNDPSFKFGQMNVVSSEFQNMYTPH